MLIFALLLLLAFSALSGIGLALWINGQTIMPGVEVYGVSIGGLSTGNAQNRLQMAWSQPSIVLVGDCQTWVASPEALGLTLDAEGTIDRARQIGRSPDSLKEWLTNEGQVTIEPIWSFDPVKAEEFLGALAPEIALLPVDAGIRIIDGRAEMTPPFEGRALDVTATLDQLTHDPQRIQVEGNISLITQSVQPAVLDTSATVAAANEKLSVDLHLHAFDPVSSQTMDIVVTPELWRPWLTLDLGDSGQLNWDIQHSQLKAFLREQSTALGSGRYLDVDQASAAISQAIINQQDNVELRIYHDERQHTVQPGETLSSIGRHYGIPYPWIQQANPGLGSGLFAGQTLRIPSPDVLLPLPVVRDKRIVVSLSQQRVWVYEDGELKWEWLASTGIDDSPTSPGVFQIQSHEPNAYANNWDLWMPHFMGVYRPVPYADFMNGFHGFPTRSGHNLLWTGDLGRRVTYGCILLSSENATALYNWAEDGVVVEIQP
jgi:lipoprotein-anchoring transpeptidase ErfK/SrfK